LNIGSGTGVSVREIIRIVGAGVGVEPQVNFFPARSVDISRVVLDCGLANAQLGWVASTALEVGVGKTIVWFRDMANTES
jgi:UDP-glucuronate decarboxylase